jgi:O-antigen/teichoic acid export membrane protein
MATNEAVQTTKNLVSVALLKGVQYPILLLFMLLVPRMMGPELYGQYALLISIIAIVTALTDLGITEIYGRFVPELRLQNKGAAIGQFSSYLLALKIVADLIIAAGLYLVLPPLYGSHFPRYYFLVIGAIVLVADMGSIPFALLFGLNQLGKYALRDPVRRALSLGLLLLLFHYFGLLGALLSTLMVESILATVYFYWTRPYFRRLTWPIDFQLLRFHLQFGLVFYFSWGVLNLWQRLGNSLIQYMTENPKEIARFDLPNQYFLVLVSTTLVIIAALVPMFTQLSLTQSEQKIAVWSKRMTKYLGIGCMLFYLVFVFVGEEFIEFMIGPEFHDIFANTTIILLGIFPLNFAQLGYTYSVVYKQPKKYLLSLCLALSVFLCFSFLLVPRYQSLGCIIAMLCSCIGFALSMFCSFKEKMLPCVIPYVEVIFLGGLFLPFVFFKADFMTNMWYMACAIASYICLLFLLKLLNIAEIREIISVLRQRSSHSTSLPPDA